MMTPRIRRILAVLAVAVLAIPINIGLSSPAAAAFGDETFGCRVSPGTDLTWRTHCMNNLPSASYVAGFALLNTTGSYTFSWSISGSHNGILSGCTSTSSDCALHVSDGSSVTVTVTYSQGGQSRTQSAAATIIPYCGPMPF